MLKMHKYILPKFHKITQTVKKQIILLRIPNEEVCHYIAVKKLPALLRRLMSKHNGYY